MASLSQVSTRILNWLEKILIEPLETLPKADDRRRAIIASAFLLLGIIGVLLERINLGRLPYSALAILVVSYFAARTRLYKAAVLILLLMLSFPSYWVVLTAIHPTENFTTVALTWLTLPLILSSLVYPVWATSLFSLLNILLIATLPMLRVGLSYEEVRGSLGFYVVVVAFVVTVMVQRNMIENDRRKELLESRNQLSEEAAQRKIFAEQAQRHAEQLSMVNRINHAVSSLHSLEGILQLVFEQVKRNFEPDVFFIALINDKTQTVSFPIMFDGGQLWNEPVKSIQQTNSIAMAAASKQPSLWNRSLDEIEEARNSSNRVGDPSRVAASIMIAPLMVGDQAIGALSIQSYQMNAYNEEGVSLLDAVAQQVTVAIENAHLFDEARKHAQQLAILNEISREISTLSDLPTLMEIVYLQVQKILPVDLFFIGIYDPQKNELSFPIMYDNGQRWEQTPATVTEETFSGKVILTREPFLTDEWADIVPDNASPPVIIGDRTKKTRSLMFAPMLLGLKAIGVISVQSYQADIYDEDDLNLLSGVASQVSIAIENSRLYTSAQQEIVERKRIEEQLRIAETQYREMVEHIPAVIYKTESGATGRWFYVSPQIESLLGFTAEEWIDDPNLWYRQVHPEDRDPALAEEEEQLANNQRVNIDYRMYSRDGHILWIHDESTSVSISEDNVYLVQGFLMDFTMRKQSELSLKESEERYHTLFVTTQRQAQELALLSTVQSAITREIDLDDLFQKVVEAIAETFGYTFVSLYILEKEYLQLRHQIGYEAEQVIERISADEGISGQVIKAEQPILISDVTLEPDFLRASAEIHSEVCVPLFDDDQICGVLNVESSSAYQLTEADLRLMNMLAEQISMAIRRGRLYEERTENLRREQHINEFAHAVSSTVELSNILEIAARVSAVLTGAETGTVSIMDEGGSEITDVYSFNEVGNMSHIIPRGHGVIWHIYETGMPLIVDDYPRHPKALEMWSKSGLHTYMGTPITMSGRRFGVLSVYNRTPTRKFTKRDLSMLEVLAGETAVAIQNSRLFKALQKELADHKQTQKQLLESVNELENKNAELERFTYSVSHDLKSPIVTIGGFLGFLETDIQKGDPQQIEKTMTRIREATKKMERLLNELLELSRVGRLINPPKEIPFGELVSEALELVDGQLQEKQVEVRVEADLPMVRVDRVRMVEVLQNLVSNATKFMGDQKQPLIEIGVKRYQDTNIFFIKDNGMGIAPEFHERIFGLFNKLDQASEGTGIGLALVKRIVEVHGGKIWVESEIGKGATFYFTFELKNFEELS